GFGFDAWTPALAPAAEDAAYTAAYTENKYTATVNATLDGVAYGENAPAIKIGLTDYASAVDNGSSVVPETYKIFADEVDTGKTITVSTANVSQDLNYWTIVFDYDGGGDNTSVVYLDGAVILDPVAPSLSGYEFTVWDPEYTSGATTATGTQTYVAQYAKDWGTAYRAIVDQAWKKTAVISRYDNDIFWLSVLYNGGTAGNSGEGYFGEEAQNPSILNISISSSNASVLSVTWNESLGAWVFHSSKEGTAIITVKCDNVVTDQQVFRVTM
ncbi:MAG: hypothetical protein LBK41_08065, partial [Clostridiales bacterium]|nr:hypothetical protein [Clostridiales bacterium]